MLQNPAPGDWLMWRRTLNGWGYSPLEQINRFIFSDPPTTEIYTLSLHDALPISRARWRDRPSRRFSGPLLISGPPSRRHRAADEDRKSTRLNSSHSSISYAVFCLKKKSSAASRSFP